MAMNTNKERLTYLKHMTAMLGEQIEAKDLQDDYLAMQEKICNGTLKLTPIDEALWEAMLPKEREVNLLVYYHTVRIEMLAMQAALEEEERRSHGDKLRWLDSKWIKRILTMEGLIKLTIVIYETGHIAGCWYREDQDNSLWSKPRTIKSAAVR